MSHGFRSYGRQTAVAMTGPRSGERSYDRQSQTLNRKAVGSVV